MSGTDGSGGRLLVDPYQITIENGSGTNTEDVVYEEFIEQVSQNGNQVFLEADSIIVANTLSGGTDPGLEGGSGELVFRTKYNNGSITFDTADTISTDSGGNIYMLAGEGGITVGDIEASAGSSENEPGKIRLLTNNGGPIETGHLMVHGGAEVEISVIASGNLTVNDDVTAITNRVSAHNPEAQKIGQARICLVSDRNVSIDGEVTVDAHGKNLTTADIRICAGDDVTINLEPSEGIYAYANTTQSGSAQASVIMSAGGNTGPDGEPGSISINGGDSKGVHVKANSGETGSPIELYSNIDAPQPESPDDPDLESWYKTDNAGSDKPPSDPDCQYCADCPKPPFLPPVPAIIFIVDDSFTFARNAANESVDVLANDDDGVPLVDGEVISYDYGGSGTLIEVTDSGDVISFLYTPPEDAVFEWDGTSDYAVFTDTFTYEAEDAEGNVSVNTATVTITVTNFLPVLSDDSGIIHMSTTNNQTNASFDLLDGLITDADGSYQDLIKGYDDSATVGGTVSVPGSTAIYQPYDGFVTEPGTPDSFQYTVEDDHIVYEQSGDPVVLFGTIEVTVENELPSGTGDLGTIHMNT
ncbi:MAG: Ig-like domain-containing protein, partial [Planctomycetota bacterium]